MKLLREQGSAARLSEAETNFTRCTRCLTTVHYMEAKVLFYIIDRNFDEQITKAGIWSNLTADKALEANMSYLLRQIKKGREEKKEDLFQMAKTWAHRVKVHLGEEEKLMLHYAQRLFKQPEDRAHIIQQTIYAEQEEFERFLLAHVVKTLAQIAPYSSLKIFMRALRECSSAAQYEVYKDIAFNSLKIETWNMLLEDGVGKDGKLPGIDDEAFAPENGCCNMNLQCPLM